MEQETITRRGGEVIIAPIEQLASYEMANIQINTDERNSIVIQNKEGYDIATMYTINGAIDRIVFWSVGSESLKEITWFTDEGQTIKKQKEINSGVTVTELSKVKK